MRTFGLAVISTLLLATIALAEPVPIKIRVTGWFSQRDYGSLIYKENIVMPMNPGQPITAAQRWSLTCERAVSEGVYEGTYDHEKNKLRLETTDLKGKSQITKCEVFSHDWRAPAK